ncbi:MULTISPECIES: hypothetical protein [Marinovum]|uniref:hypothetical protein n=1 Tax=Marinovum TaxID=367771 RepID=UPI00237AD7CD|nr:hypothetical protein [Marinovum sp. PR37]MDD9742672.1 hypothetical protein [Marinovum sp. PR37]
MLRRVAILGLCLGLIGPAWSDSAPPAAPASELLTPEDSRALILRALSADRHDIAGKLALGLLRADPEDPFGHMVMSTVLMRAGNLEEARRAAKLAYRHADTRRQRHEAARVVAATEARDERFVLGQLWMRRALQAAPTAPTRNRSIHEYRALRSAARLKFQIAGQIAPSSNVNNGSADRINVIDGIPVVGILPAASQALSGTIAEIGGRFSYRLHQGAASETRLTGGGQLRRVRLSDEARKKAPQAEDADYGSTYVALGLSHHRALGAAGGLASARLSFGQVWNGGDRSYDLASGGLSYGFDLGPELRLTAGANYQIRHNDADGLADVETTGVSFGAIHTMANKDRLALTVGTTWAASDNGQSRSTERSARLSYHRAKPIGPVSLSAAIGVSETTYPDYRILFWSVPGGREDTRSSAEVNVSFDRLGYMGFTPTLKLSSERTLSNVSRFETDELSVSLGLRTAF